MKRMQPDARKAEILAAALDTARAVGYRHVSREAIAATAGCSPGLVSAYFGTMPALRRAIMSAAIARRDLVVLAQGLAAGDSKAKAAPEALRRAAAKTLV